MAAISTVSSCFFGSASRGNQRDKFDHAFVLQWAAQEGYLDVVKRLAEAGADIDGAGDEHEMGVIGWATCVRQVRLDMAEFLLARGAKPTIFAAVALGRADLVRRLINGDRWLVFRQVSRFKHRRTPLHFAVLKNRPDMVDLLLELGADPTIKDYLGQHPAHLRLGQDGQAHRRTADRCRRRSDGAE